MEHARKPYPPDTSDEVWSLIVPYLTLQSAVMYDLLP